MAVSEAREPALVRHQIESTKPRNRGLDDLLQERIYLGVERAVDARSHGLGHGLIGASSARSSVQMNKRDFSGTVKYHQFSVLGSENKHYVSFLLERRRFC